MNLQFTSPCCFVSRAALAPLASLAILLTVDSPALAADKTWDGAGLNSQWGTADNWAGSVNPANGDTLFFDGEDNLNAVNDLTLNNIQSLTFNEGAGAFVLSGNALALASAGSSQTGYIANYSSNLQTINFNINPGTLRFGGSGDIEIGGAVNFAGGGPHLQKYGSNTVTLKGGAALSTATLIGIQGNLVLDQSAAPALSNISGIQLGGGTLTFKGATSGGTAITANVLTLTPAGSPGIGPRKSSIVFDDNGGTGTTLTIGTFNRINPSTLYVDYSLGGGLAVTGGKSVSHGITPNVVVRDATGIGFGTYSGNDLVRNTAMTTLSAGSSLNTANFVTSGDLVMTNVLHAMNSLTIDASATAGSLDVGVGVPVSVSFTSGGGMLMYGSNDYEIKNGTVRGADVTNPLFIHQYGSGVLTVSSTITQAILVKDGGGTLRLTAANTYTQATWIHEGTLLLAGGSIASSSEVNVSGGILAGHGAVSLIKGSVGTATSGTPIRLLGDGLVDAGTAAAAGILSATAVNVGTATENAPPFSDSLDFKFDFKQAAVGGESIPVYGNAASSGNDVLRLTSATPFTVALTSANTIILDFSSLTLNFHDVLYGGFYADQADFLSSIAGANFQYVFGAANAWVNEVEMTVVQQTADFGNGAVNGYVMQFTVIPEPQTVVMLVAGSAMVFLRRRLN